MPTDHEPHERSCVFCRIPVTPPGKRPPYDTILLDGIHSYVVPAVGALEIGHVLAVTREHFTSLAESTQETLREITQHVTQVAERYGMVLLSEHGSVNGCGGGACIDHAHLSILPIYNRAMIPDPPLRLIGSETDLTELTKYSADPYLLVGTGTRLSIFDGNGIRSQLIRLAYCETQKRDDWDWVLHPAPEVVRATIETW